MPNKKDSKGRVLKNGERQRSDGRYEYRFTTPFGDVKSIYSWRLVESDKLPAGKRKCDALREMEKDIERDLLNGTFASNAANNTLNAMFDSSIRLKRDLRSSTRVNYESVYNCYARNTIGNMKMRDIKRSDLKKFFVATIEERGVGRGAIGCLNSAISVPFADAVNDGVLMVNPTIGLLKSLNMDGESKERDALTKTQQSMLVNYCKGHEKYGHFYLLILFMLSTGCRVGEATGMRWEDIDFEKNIISVNHALSYRKDPESGKHKFHIDYPKTKKGVRKIPLLRKLREELLEEKKIQDSKSCGNDPVVDGVGGFIFRGKNNELIASCRLDYNLARIVSSYNDLEARQAKIENRAPEVLPTITSHIFRHTFCSRLCENETNLKLIQDVMGHASIDTTMRIYAHVSDESKVDMFKHLDTCIN